MPHFRLQATIRISTRSAVYEADDWNEAKRKFLEDLGNPMDGRGVEVIWEEGEEVPSAQVSPTHTDLMVSPEEIDSFLDEEEEDDLLKQRLGSAEAKINEMESEIARLRDQVERWRSGRPS